MDGCGRHPRIFVELFLKTTDFVNHMEIRENCCGGVVGLGRIGKNVLPEGIAPSTLIIMIVIAGNDHDLLDLWAMGQAIIESTRVHMSPCSVLVKIVFKTTGFINNMAIRTNCCGGFVGLCILGVRMFSK
jgi:hypothetical protein